MEKMATIMKTPMWLLIALFFTPVISFANDQSMHARGNAEEVLLSQAVEAPVSGLARERSAPIRDGLEQALLLQAIERQQLNQRLSNLVEGYYVRKNHESHGEKLCPLRSIQSMPGWDC